MTDTTLPLQGVRVLELTQNVMGPTCGLILADMGAEVIRIEKPGGDDTRRLKGFGQGFFPFYNRNKKSICLDLKNAADRDVLEKLIKTADVFMENFAPNTIERLGFSSAHVRAVNPRIIFCSMKGFMKGPYENRAALDEVVQMMTGLAHMTGPAGTPLRAGASVIDVMGGTFAALGVLAALNERNATGEGTTVTSSLFEASAFLMGQHMAYQAVTGQPPRPMPERVSSWAVYDIFETADDEKVFIGITSDRHWKRFCASFGLEELARNSRYATNHQRIDERATLIPLLRAHIAGMGTRTVLQCAESASIPFGRVAAPGDLFDDPQMNAPGNLMTMRLPDGVTTRLPALPMRMGSHAFGLRHDPPALNDGAAAVLESAGVEPAVIETILERE